MRFSGTTLSLAATDLSNFPGCRHRTALERESAAGTISKPFFDNPLLQLLRKRGVEHEQKHLTSLRDSGREIVDLSDAANSRDPVDETLAAMRAGAEVIYQGALRHDQWYGRTDIL